MHRLFVIVAGLWAHAALALAEPSVPTISFSEAIGDTARLPELRNSAAPSSLRASLIADEAGGVLVLAGCAAVGEGTTRERQP